MEEVTAIAGLNGVGKTSVLDAIHFLCLGKSYFSSTDVQCIQSDQLQSGILAEVENQSQFDLKIKLKRGARKIIEKDNEVFFKMKPTLIYVLFGAAITYGQMRGKGYLKALLGERIPMENIGWQLISRRLAMFFFALAALNEIIWRTQSSETWVYFKTFGLTSAVFIFMILQYPILKKYGRMDEL